MTTGPGRNRRRRGRRGQRPRQDDQRKDQQVPEDGPTEDAPSRRDTATGDNRPQREVRQRRGGDQAQGDRQGGAGRKRSRSKRRPNRRPAISAMPTEVLKEEVRDVRPSGTIVLHSLDEFTTADGMNFGCPMLTRTRLGMPFARGQRPPRCSMGWALHTEEEASFCMRTPDLLDCWKAHPDREAALRSGTDEENAAD
jgi:hypothetical protein